MNEAQKRFTELQAKMAKAAQSTPTMSVAKPAVTAATARVGAQLARQGIRARGEVRQTATGLKVTLAVPRRLAPQARGALRSELTKQRPVIARQLRSAVKGLLK